MSLKEKRPMKHTYLFHTYIYALRVTSPEDSMTKSCTSTLLYVSQHSFMSSNIQAWCHRALVGDIFKFDITVTNMTYDAISYFDL